MKPSLFHSQDNPAFSFALPLDSFARKDGTGPGLHHIGDVTFMFRTLGHREATYRTMTTVSLLDRPTTLEPTPHPGRLYHVDLSPLLPKDSPIRIERWLEIPSGGGDAKPASRPVVPGEVHLWFNISNTGRDNLEIGAFGISLPMVRARLLNLTELICSKCKTPSKSPFLNNIDWIFSQKHNAYVIMNTEYFQ